MTRNNNAESGANVLADTTLPIAVSNNNKDITDTLSTTDSEDQYLADITTAKEIATSTDIHRGIVIGTEVKKFFAGAGWFTGRVNKIASFREDSHQVRFQEDGDIAFMSVRTIIDLQQ